MKLKKIVSGLTSLAMSLTAFAGIGASDSARKLDAKAAAANWSFDFGADGTANGFTGVSASDGYNASKGYGFAQTWNMANVSAAGKNELSDAVQFKSTDTGNTFNVDLPKGLYQVTVHLGNTNRTSVRAEGMLQLINLTGNNASDTFQIPVTDGQLNIQACEGKAGYAFTMSSLEIRQINTTGETNPTVWLCGDSTVANYYNVADTSQHGWGMYIGDYIDNSYWQVRNMAASGQYAKGFVDAGQFDAIETYGKTGDIYIISIGINDTNYSNAEEYRNTVTDMVKRAKAKGMTVYLVKQQGRRGDLTRNPLLKGRWFGGELDKVGAEQNVEVIDLFTPWQDFGISVGYDGMASYYAIQANGSADDLHQSALGSKKIAEIMSELINFTGREPAVMDESVSYMFKNVNSGLYMEVAEAKAEAGANVQQWGAEDAAAHNTWRLKAADSGFYYVYSNLGDGETYLLDLDAGKTANGTNIGIYTDTGSTAQHFKFYENDDGSYTIVTRATGGKGAVEVKSALNDSGANIQQWEVNGHNCQKWNAEKVEYPPVTTTTTTTTTTTIVTTSVTTAEPVLKKFPGDTNVDNEVNLADAILIMQNLANPNGYVIEKQGLINADVVDNDGVTSNDALFIQKCCLGIEKLPEKEYEIPEITTTTTTTVTTTTTTIPYYFAVDQIWDKGVIETVNAGYTKDEGYVNLDNVIDSSITWTVNASQSGNYLTTFRVANGTDSDREMKIVVNGNNDSYWIQSFTGTGAWTSWEERGIVLPLKEGQNTVKLISRTASGGPNFDYLTIELTDEPIAEIYDPSNDPQFNITDKPVIYIAGDSTVQSYRASYAPQQGWGYYLGDYFTDNVTVANHSIAGRSSKSFYDQGRFQTIVDNLKKGDFVMIQFAINDSAASIAERYAPVCGNVDNPASGSYEWYLTQFIKDTQAKGATPILVTTVIGMKAYSGGKFVGSYTNYCDACKKLAAKYNIPCIDLNTLMVNHYNSIGYDAALKYHLMGVVEGSTDGTHFCETGANAVAGIVANAVKDQKISGLSEYAK